MIIDLLIAFAYVINNVIDDVAKSIRDVFNEVVVFDVKARANESELNLTNIVSMTIIMNIIHAIKIVVANFLT